MSVLQANAQSINLRVDYNLEKQDRNNSILDINIVIYNNDTIQWYYPKEIGQTFTNKLSIENYNKAKFGIRPSLDLAFDVGSAYEMNYFDSLIIISPNDSIIISYKNLLINKKNKNLSFTNFITSDKNNDRMSKSGNRYFHPYSSTVYTAKVKLKRRGSKFIKTIELKKNINSASL
jgi:hypothetical protein